MSQPDLYSNLAYLYPIIYGEKDYVAEAMAVSQLLQARGVSAGQKLLDVACGTGEHLAHWRHTFKVEGLDLSLQLLDIAREKLPMIDLREADMRFFHSNQRYNAITCMFSALGYIETHNDLLNTMINWYKHLEDGGICVIQPWLTPNQFDPLRRDNLLVKTDNVTVHRASETRREGHFSIVNFHYIVSEVGAPIQYFTEEHKLRLFTVEQITLAMEAAGFSVEHLPTAMSRGLYIGTKG